MLLVSHPTGNTFVRALVSTLEERGLLRAFATTLAVHERDALVRLLPARLRKQALRRGYAVSREHLMRFPAREAMRHAASKLGLKSLTHHETGAASVDAVYRDLDTRIAARLPGMRGLSGVYCYEDGALHTFRAAQNLGLRRFYELPIAYWETSARLLREEAERYPEWEPTLVATRESPAKLMRKTQEVELADVVITPSRFVFDSLPASVRQSKACHVVPFGSPHVDGAARAPERPASEPLRVLFAGSMTQRKGLADLMAAVEMLQRRDVELVVLGSPIAPLEFYRRHGSFRYEAPRPHAEVLQLMRGCDILALPSIVEGRALVQQEAMACGLPLLVTPNAGGEDLIDEGCTGFLVPIRSPATIAEKIAFLANHREELPAMRDAARFKAAQYTWERYGAAIADLVEAPGAG